MQLIMTIFFILLFGTATGHAIAMDAEASNMATQSDSARPFSSDLEEPTFDLTLNRALSMALSRHPELTMLSHEEQAREAATRQAGLPPNPILSASLEDIAGSGAFQGIDQMQTTLQWSQSIELGGKRFARTRKASLTQDLTKWDILAKRNEITAEVTSAFVALLGAQQQHAYLTEATHLAEQVTRIVAERVRAGKGSPIEETKATLLLAASQIDLKRSDLDLQAARETLATTWGSSVASFHSAKGEMETLSQVAPLSQLIPHLDRNPDMARLEAELNQRRAAVDLEKAQAIPDLTLSFGIRQFSERGDTAFLVGMSLPLPIVNRNEGAVEEARIRETIAEVARRATRLRLVTTLTEAHRALVTAYTEASLIKTTLLPRAQETFDAVSEGYRLGKFDLLDVLDAQRTLVSVRMQYLRALTEYHKSAADVERLVGKQL
ncbi:MAG: TolC family protein [Nitrospirota bacterium]